MQWSLDDGHLQPHPRTLVPENKRTWIEIKGREQTAQLKISNCNGLWHSRTDIVLNATHFISFSISSSSYFTNDNYFSLFFSIIFLLEQTSQWFTQKTIFSLIYNFLVPALTCIFSFPIAELFEHVYIFIFWLYWGDHRRGCVNNPQTACSHTPLIPGIRPY